MPESQVPADRTPTTPFPAPQDTSRSQRPHPPWASSLITGVVVLGALALGVVIGSLLFSQKTNEGKGSATNAQAAADTVWTCSMHPQIRQPKPGDCPICGMDLIPATSGGGEEATSLREVSISREARQLLDLQVTPVERRFVTTTVRMVGKIEYDETRLGYLTAWVPGRLDRLFVDYTGVEVQKGDHMVSIYSPELYSAQAELIRARQATQQRRTGTAVLSAERLLESSREKLRLWGLNDDQIRAIEGQEEPSDHLTIYAPMAGIVIQKNLQEGAYVDTGTRIYTIADLSEVWVKLDAYESDLSWLRYGQEVEFTTEAYPGEVFTGTIAFIDPVLNPQTRTVKVRVNVPNPNGKLKPDMFVRASVRAQVATAGRVMDPNLVGKWICRMHPGVVKDSAGDCDVCGMPLVRTESLGYVSALAAANESAEPLVVPASAVLKTGTRAIVYVERPEADKPTYEGREIVLGPRAGDFYIVRTGLEEGERVVTQGNFKLDSALQIAAKPSMMNPQGGALGGDAHQHGSQHASAGSDSLANASARPTLPPSITAQLNRLQRALQDVTAATKTADRETVRSALQTFEKHLADVESAKLKGQDALAWKELAMRLRNDAVAGRWAVTDTRIQEAVKQLSTDMNQLANRFALASNPSNVAAAKTYEVPADFRAQLKQLWDAYVKTQNALAADNPAQARTAAIEAKAALLQVNMALLKDQAHSAWMASHDELLAAIDPMTAATDLDALRKNFENWSQAMPAAVTSFGLPSSAGPVYQLFCPMAFDNKGAAWLQADPVVRNPYFGPAMLTCATDTSLIWNGPPADAGAHQHLAVPPSFRAHLEQLWKTYLEAQTALAQDDSAKAAAAAQSLAESLAAINASNLEGKALEVWEREHANLQAAVDRMTAAPDILPMRAGFALLSEVMPVILEAYNPEIGNDTYNMHCPMAFDGRGAAWLQSGEQPRNPYFGATMLRCVDKVEKLTSNTPQPAAAEVQTHD